MIYFLDNSLQLQKIVTSKNVISAIHEHELNGLIRADVELDLSYANKFLVLGIDHVGYYYKDEFYLHKIQRVEYDHVNESAKVVLRHIFFEDMIFGKLIQDVRPQNQDALTVSRQTIDANTRWQTIMTDVTGRLSTNFYWQVPYEVIEFMTENYRIEYLPKILFDGQNINGFQLHLANKIGEDKNIRIPYGSRVLDLKYEEDYSEIITKLVVHGKGEEVGSGYGRRINISDVNFSRNGVESPVGSLYLEDETITNTYGNDGQTPREGREVFEDIEDANELAEAGYQHYLQVSRPQMLFTADVADIGDVGIGDSVMIIRREYDVYFKARIHKLSVDLLYPEDAQVELGDYEHFKESKIARKTREKNNRVQGQLSDRITRLKQEADERFDNEVGQWKSEYEQALIDVHAEIEADRESMTNLIEGTRTEFTDNLNAEIAQTKEYAEQQAQEKADSVQTNLNSFSERHQQLYDEVTGNILDINTFLGDKSVTLAKQFAEMETGLNQSITAEAGRIDAIVTNFGDSGKSLAQFVLDVDSIETAVAKNDAWLGTYGSAAEQTIAGFEQKVWKSDIHNPNIIPFNNLTLVENRKQWLTRSFDGLSYLSEQKMIRISNYTSPHNYVQSPYVSLQAGETYTLSFTSLIGSSYNLNDLMQYTYVVYPEIDNVLLRDLMKRELIGSAYGVNIYKFTATFTAEETTDKARILIGAYVINQGQRSDLYIGEPKLEMGEIATLYNNALSIFEQRADELKLAVTDSDGLASVIALSPTAIDFISDKINVTGNANINGGVTALAVDAIEGNFARLFANHLTVDVITADHLAVGTAMIDKFFATSARIDRLITKTHFVNEMHALTLNVIDLNASNIRTRLLSANTIEAEWLKGGTALLDRVFSSTAMFERMMAKSGFVTTLNTVTIDTDQITIRRPDGVPVINNGMASFDYTVQMTEYIRDADVVSWNGSFYQMNSSVRRHVMIGNFKHSARYLKVGLVLGMHGSSPSNSEYMYYRIESFGGPLSYTKQEKVMVFRNSNTDVTAEIDLGRPTFQRSSFYIYLVKANASDGGTNAGNIVQLRTNSAYLEG